MMWLLAALGRAERLEAMRRGFTSKAEGGAAVWYGMLVVALIGVTLVGILLVVNRMQEKTKKGPEGSVNRLFLEVLFKLPIGLGEKLLLKRMSRGMQNPTVMLLTPQLFSDAAHAYVAGPSGRAQADLAKLQRICQQLFDQPLPKPRRHPSAAS